MHTNKTLRAKIQRTLNVKRALLLVWKSAPGWTVANAALLFIQGLLPLLSLYLTKLLVDAVTSGIASGGGEKVFWQVTRFIAFMGGVSLFEVLCRSVTNVVSEAQSQAVADHVNDEIHNKSIEVDLEYYENHQYYDTLHRVQREASSRPAQIVNGLVKLGRNGITLLAMVGLLFSFHWSIGIILFAAVIPGIFVRVKYSRKMYRWRRESTPRERQAHYLHWLLTGERYAREIRLFGLGNFFKHQFSDLRKQVRREKLYLTVRRSVEATVSQAVAILAIFGSYTYIVYQTVQGLITLGSMVMYFQAFRQGQGYLRDMLGSLVDLYENNLFLSHFYEFLDLEPKVGEPEHPVPAILSMRTGIRFEHLSFQYSSGNRKVLKDIDLTIRPGEHIALVGANGAGKTTLIKLLCRLYDPSSGKITMDGTDLRQFNTTDLRRQIGIVFQDYAKYQMTARENIWFGDIGSPLKGEAVLKAARYSGADDVIADLPEGYETMLGRMFDNGCELSEGEWQKLALARAFLRDAQILILDEPTSALDAKTEYEVFKQFHQLAKNKTVILISHRMSTVRMADRIFILEDGKIVENGTHEELVCRKGTYANLFEMQAQRYR